MHIHSIVPISLLLAGIFSFANGQTKGNATSSTFSSQTSFVPSTRSTTTRSTTTRPSTTRSNAAPTSTIISCYDDDQPCAKYDYAQADCFEAWNPQKQKLGDLESCQCGANHLWLDAVSSLFPTFFFCVFLFSYYLFSFLVFFLFPVLTFFFLLFFPYVVRFCFSLPLRFTCWTS